MLELIAAGTLGIAGHIKSKGFTRGRLRYTQWIEKPGLGLFAGAATMVATGAVVAMLPIVGPVTAIAVGAGVGTGVAIGARQAREGWSPED